MKKPRVRAIVICVCRRGDRIPVSELRDIVKKETFYRPLGGTIEFGERGEAALRREFSEEINAELSDIRYLGTLENIFTCDGRRGHEIVLVYDGRLADESLYEQKAIRGNELGTPFLAVWKRLDEFGPSKPPLYPDGLLELLQA